MAGFLTLLRNSFLLILALVLLLILGLPVFIVQVTIRRSKINVNNYILNLATSLDYTGGALLHGEDGHTISALCHKKAKTNEQFKKYERWIDKLFQKDGHCRDAYIYEYIVRPRINLEIAKDYIE